MSTVPSIAGDWAHNCIVAWDAAAALLLMESALRERPNEVRGTTFLVTGKDQPWCYDKLRRTSKVRAPRYTYCRLSSAELPTESGRAAYQNGHFASPHHAIDCARSGGVVVCPVLRAPAALRCWSGAETKRVAVVDWTDVVPAT